MQMIKVHASVCKDVCVYVCVCMRQVREKKEKLVFAMEKHNRLMLEGTCNSGRLYWQCVMLTLH